MALASESSQWRQELRTLLLLGRISNLPTVWSNCLAGWLLADGGRPLRFVLLCLGASCLYIGGMFLNDAFDVEFDRQYRQERPIPSGWITPAKVWGWGFGWLLAGLLLLSLLGTLPMCFALLLAGCILLYDAIHKAMTLSPILMALCRFLLYLVAAAAARRHFPGLVVWSALALSAYVIGLSYLARKESARGQIRYWPCWLLATPILCAWIVNAGPYTMRAIVFSLLLGLWGFQCLRNTYAGATPSVGRTVAGLLAGICLVDLLAVAGGTPATGSAFIVLFIGAVLCQRFIPAT